MSDFEIGPIQLRPQRRLLETAAHSVTVEPLVMLVLVTLSRQAGVVVTRRDIFQTCWGTAPVGDDSLNRIIAVLRKLLRQIAGDAVQIETVPGTGYLLRLCAPGLDSLASSDGSAARRAIEAARSSWRWGLPEADHLRIEQLRHATRSEPANANAWGMLAFLCRYAAEYAGPELSADYVAECELAAERALAIDASQAEALVALATVAPLFGRWLPARTRLEAIVGERNHCAPAVHELAIVEMATGRVGQAKRLMDTLIAADPLAACYNYKSIWQHWSVGDLAGMDHVADRAIQLWPLHPAVWTARFWTLVHTDRPRASMMMLEDSAARPIIPPPMLQFLLMVAHAAASGDVAEVERSICASRAAAEKGPAQAVASLLTLGLFGATDEAFDVAQAYYVRAGNAPVPVRHMKGEPSINDQHRRVTQPLFTPATACMRSDPRFAGLCERIGLAAYWDESGLSPDFLQVT